jgi:cytochrome c553
LPPADENLIAGGKLYLRACAGCHGKPGKLRDNPGGYPPPPQFFQVGTQYSEPELFWIVKHGIRRTGMSAYGAFYSDQEMWTLAAFVKRMNNLPPTVLAGGEAHALRGNRESALQNCKDSVSLNRLDRIETLPKIRREIESNIGSSSKTQHPRLWSLAKLASNLRGRISALRLTQGLGFFETK